MFFGLYEGFSRRVLELKGSLIKLIQGLKAGGKIRGGLWGIG